MNGNSGRVTEVTFHVEYAGLRYVIGFKKIE